MPENIFSCSTADGGSSCRDGPNSSAALKKRLGFTGTPVKDTELSDKAEPVAGMLTGANLAGTQMWEISERLFPEQEDLHCISRQADGAVQHHCVKS